MPVKAKMFWGPWALMMCVAALCILVGSLMPLVAGAQPSSASASMAYIDVTKVPITILPDKSATQPAVVVAPVKPDDPKGAAAVVASAMRTSNWRLAVLAGLLLAVLILRKVGGWFLPAKAAEWVQSDRGGATLALAAGVLTVFVNGLIAGKGADPQLLIDGVLAAATAAGTFNIAKRLAKPSDLQATPAGPDAPKITQ